MSTNFLHPAQTLILTHLSPESVEKMWNQTQETLRTNLFLAIRLVVFSAARNHPIQSLLLCLFLKKRNN